MSGPLGGRPVGADRLAQGLGRSEQPGRSLRFPSRRDDASLVFQPLGDRAPDADCGEQAQALGEAVRRPLEIAARLGPPVPTC